MTEKIKKGLDKKRERGN